MFDIGWSEMAVIALLTLIVIGPKELPRVMRNVGHWVRKAQSLAREFQRGLDDMMRESELEDAKKLVDAGRSLNPKKAVMDVVDPSGDVEKEASDLQASVADKEPAKTEESPAPKASDTAAPEQSSDDAEASAEDEPKATVIKHPVNIAPPHSIKPPPETDAEPEAAVAREDDSQKTA